MPSHQPHIARILKDVRIVYDSVMLEETGRSYSLELAIDTQNMLNSRVIKKGNAQDNKNSIQNGIQDSSIEINKDT